nr:NAD(P)-dependent oxidoreductase [Candidatus Sigynarchaeota archaeon]
MPIVGLIGIGLVGTGLAEMLVKSGFEVIGYDIVPEKIASLERLGGKAATSPADVAARAPRVVLSLMTSAIIREVLFGKDGILSAPRRPEIIIDTSTGSPEEAASISVDLGKEGIEYLEAPISGTSKQVSSGEAVYLVGGSRAAFDSCEDIFQALGNKAIYLGGTGYGARAKLAINLVLGLNRAALAEGIVFAEALGIDGNAFLDLLRLTPAYSRVVDLKGSKMVQGDFTTEGKLAQHRKDVGLMIRAAERAGKILPLSDFHARLLDKAIANGDGDLDNSAIIKEIRRRSEKKGS